MKDLSQLDITQILERVQAGDAEAQASLLAALYNELHGLAKHHMRGQPAGHTLQPTALLHEAWIRLEKAQEIAFTSRTHFLRYASKAMRSVLLDHARKRDADIRPPASKKVPLDGMLDEFNKRAVNLIALDAALAELQSIDAPMAEAVELRFFGGISMEEVASILGMAPRTLDRRWKATKAWLRAHVE